MGRSVTGEREGTYSILNLVENVIGLSGNVETRVRKIQEILLLRSDVRKIFDVLNDADPATMKAIADYLAVLLAQYRRLDVDLTTADMPSVINLIGNYRPLINNQFDSIQLKFGPNYEDLSTRITNLEITGGHRAPTQYFIENTSVWAPNVAKTIKRLNSYQQTHVDTHHHWNPTVTRNVRHLRVEQPVYNETHHHYTVSKQGGEYTLENADNLGRLRGSVVLKRNGVVVSTVQIVPDPLQNIGTLLAADSVGMHWESVNAHGTHGGGGSGGSSDGYIARLSIDTQAGAGLGKITAIRQPGSVTIQTAQSTTDIHYTKAEVDALLSAITSQHAMDVAISNGLHSLRATEVAALDARITALEAASLTFKGGNGATPVPVKQIQVAELPWAYYSTGQILWIERDTPLSSNPYT